VNVLIGMTPDKPADKDDAADAAGDNL